MAKIYFNLIISGKRTLDDVPLKWRREVEMMLEVDENEDNRDVPYTE